MPAKVLVIGLDAAEATLLERWADEGKLPTMAHLKNNGAVCRLDNCIETLPGAIWPELTTGRSGGKLGQFYHPYQFHTGESSVRPLTPEDIDADEYYWSVASRSGRRVLVIDQEQTILASGVNGLQVLEWGSHDRNFNTASDPPELIDELRRRHGDHPVIDCELNGGTIKQYQQLLTGLLEGARRKTDLIIDLLGRETWDLATCTYGETHCVGHQFWNFYDETHSLHDPDAPRELRQAIESVYRQVDEGMGRVIEAAGRDANVIVVASHGMGPTVGGPQLLPEVLSRLGLDTGKRLRLRLARFVPLPIQRMLRRLIPAGTRDRLQIGLDSRWRKMDAGRTRAISVKNNRVGAIRLNLVGREPSGAVNPGREADEVIELLRRELCELRDPRTGEVIVQRVFTAAEAFGAEYHPDVPDVMLVFRTDLGPLEVCESPRVGRVQVPLRVRTGDHTLESRLWAIGAGLRAERRVQDGNVLDLAPTVLRLLDVELPSWLDGRPLEGLFETGGTRI